MGPRVKPGKIKNFQQFSGDAEVRAKEIKKLHEEVRLKIEKKNAKYVEQANRRRKYVEFEVGELVWVHLRKDRFPPGKFGRTNSYG